MLFFLLFLYHSAEVSKIRVIQKKKKKKSIACIMSSLFFMSLCSMMLYMHHGNANKKTLRSICCNGEIIYTGIQLLNCSNSPKIWNMFICITLPAFVYLLPLHFSNQILSFPYLYSFNILKSIILYCLKCAMSDLVTY